MKSTLNERLFRREFGETSRYSKIRGIYGDKKWIKDLDIVNELNGHNGCVNTLSWSKSGNLLASGSDDTHLNIHSYQPDSTTSPFRLTTTVATGHSANIFSVKFMPHSNDRTLVTAAGDRQVRIFDIEYSAGSSVSSSTAYLASSSRAQGFISRGVQVLSEADTNTRVYRCHGDRVKRIVTESSPHLFLTCSEDGEVRQWDLRQPSSTYPKARGHRGWRSTAEDDDTGIPPPLISYKRWHLDINTLSCSATRPHYIALGGAHLHCFLHDRRMLGRDRNFERGALGTSSNMSDHDDNAMGEATQCVKRFAPNGQRRMKRTDNGHITSCKISDANPNEMVVSWSGEWIYNFNLLHTPDARETNSDGRTSTEYGLGNRNRHSNDRKRKRTKQGSPTSQNDIGRASSKSRKTTPSDPSARDEVALRVRYENGQSENIPIRSGQVRDLSEEEPSALPMTETQQRSCRLAKLSVEVRKHMFSLGEARARTIRDPTGHAASFSSVVGFAASTLDDMDDIMRTWRYIVDPDEFEVAFQKTLRSHRESARRFIQAAGTIARVLGGRLQTGGSNGGRAMDSFFQIVPAPSETPIDDSSECFSYDFIKAICLWLDSGPGALVEGFASRTNRSRSHPRFPIAAGAGIEAIDDDLIPYLLQLAGTRPIPDVNSSRFEVDDNQCAFESEQVAVLAFARAVKIPFVDLSSAVELATTSEGSGSRGEQISAQDRRTALNFWAFKVARGLLLNAGARVNHSFIDRAFGGLGRSDAVVRQEERLLSEQMEPISPDEEEGNLFDTHEIPRGIGSSYHAHDRSAMREDSDVDMTAAEFAAVAAEGPADAEEEDDEDEEDGDDEDDEDDEEEDDEDDEDEDEDEDEDDEDDEDADANFEDPDEDEESDDDSAGIGHFLYRSSFERSALREQVHANVPCATHTRYYRGHCNVKTVKDVNFFGLQDEYVVSGSDSGHVFIWDNKTSELVNILEGDGETVNVIQGHPYEPLLAVSGIDHTIKIFSPDARARRDARCGFGVAAVDPSGFSSLNYSRRSFGRRARRPGVNGDADEGVMDNNAGAVTVVDSDDTDTEPPAAPTGLKSRKRMQDEYRITSANDVERQGGNRDAVLSRAMLAQIAARMRTQRQGGGGGEEGGGGEDDGGNDGPAVPGMPMVIMGPDGPVVVNPDSCSTM